jgi:hypothetical protein
MVRVFLMAAAFVAVFGISNAQTITIGETNRLGIDDSANAGYLLAEGPFNLSQQATINSLSFYVGSVSGNLRLGIYTAGTNNDCHGGTLEAQTNSVSTSGHANSWITANVVTPVQLPVGNYCLAYEQSSNSLHSVKGMTQGVGDYWYTHSYGTFPSTFSSSLGGPDGYHWSIYGTLTPVQQQPTLSLSFSPASPSIPYTSSLGTAVAQIVPAWSDGSQFTGTVAFAYPYFSDGGCFSIDGSLNLITACSLSSDGNTVQNVTVTANQ